MESGKLRALAKAGRLSNALRCAGAIVICLVQALNAPAAKFTAALDRDTILLGETVTLTLSFEDLNPGRIPSLPSIPDLQVIGQGGSGSSSSFGSDGQGHSVTYTSIILSATKAGEIQIPALQIELGGQRYSSAPLRLKVLAEDPAAPPAELAQRPAFLWLVLPKKEFYVGESFVPELRLYLRAGVRRIDGFEPPVLQTDGLTASRWVQRGNYQRTVGNRPFTVVPLQCSVTPIKTGPLTIVDLKASVVLNPPDPFDVFFTRRSDSERVALVIEPTSLRVLPLPDKNVPADFTGAVGQYTFKVTASPTNVATGDPITIRLQISGRGPLESFSLPSLSNWPNFKSYPPAARIENSDDLGLQGTKTFEQVVSPESVSIKELPPISISFFDPEAKEYRTLTQAPIPLAVRPGGTTPTPVVAANPNRKETPPPPAQDIVHIKPRVGTLTRPGPPLIQQGWFIALQSTPLLAWLAAVGWRKRADSLANNPRLRRQRAVAQIIRDGIGELRSHASAKRSDEFFVTLFRLLQEQLGERLDCPATAITEAVVDEKLRPRGISEATLTELRELFQACNLARYAPVQSSQELAALVPRFEALIRELQKITA